MLPDKDQRRRLFAAQLAVGAILVYLTFGIEDVFSWELLALPLARYIFYFLLIRATHIARDVVIKTLAGKPVEVDKVLREHKKSVGALCASALMLAYWGKLWLGRDFFVLFVADLALQYLDMEEKRPVINYGVGMACSFFEGYLMNVIPSDGGENVGLLTNITDCENSQWVVFPVKKLLIVVTRSLFCHPNLEDLNKQNKPHLARLEGCRSLRDIERNVAGVLNRTYRNSTYKIVRPNRPHDEGVFVVAEFASALNTFYKVLQNRNLYQTLCDVDQEEIKWDFCAQLDRTVAGHPATAGRVHLVYFDDTDPEMNLADVLLAEIARLEPRYDQMVRENAQRNRAGELGRRGNEN